VPDFFSVVHCTKSRIFSDMETHHTSPHPVLAVIVRSVMVLACVLAFSTSVAVRAAESPDAKSLGADAIRATLAGNTVMWNHGKVTQRQYFDPKGYTVFEDADFNIDKGLWTVTGDGLFCSNWKQTGWACYQLALDGGAVVWTGPISPFGEQTGEQAVSRLVRGNQTTFRTPPGSRADELVATVTRELEAGTAR
jgi:hypothetical protein